MLLVILAVAVTLAEGHPQCLNYKAPFEGKETLTFCPEYQDYGCCTKYMDANINNQYSRIIQESLNDGSFNINECKDYLREILCQECSPYAAHILDSEVDLTRNPFPGLCRSYCDTFYTKCRNLVRYMTSDPNIIQSLATNDQFCREIAISDPDYCYPDLNTNPQFVREISRENRNEEGCLCLEPFADNLRNALSFRVPPDGTDRIFISEQLGQVHIYYRNKTRLSDPFMDLSRFVLSSSGAGDERGFFNIAFHPQYASNRKFYVYFSMRNENRRHHTRLSEFRARADEPNKVDTDSERVIIQIPQPWDNHNGGELLFGTDGYLYLFLGDGGAGGDPYGHSQNRSTLLGSVLRLNIDETTSTTNYSIPNDNPFINEAGSAPEIYAYGIRNIWRCDVDEGDPVTGANRGRILCGDVGQSSFEEIDIIQRGGNYGWNKKEGFACYRASRCDDVGPVVDPIYAYNHTVGKSITGGHVYRGCASPNLQGKYIYGDFNNGKIFLLTETSGGWMNKQVRMCGNDLCLNGLVNKYERNILSFGEDSDGEVYLLTTNYPSSQANSGKVYKLVDPKRRGDPSTCRTYIPPPTPIPPTQPTTHKPKPCNPNPCRNGGRCSAAEDPFGIGYYCICSFPAGGRQCQILFPCKTIPCPPGTAMCWHSDSSVLGRYCLDKNYNLL